MKYESEIKAFNAEIAQEENDQKIILEYIDRFKDNILTRENEIAHMTSSSMIFNHNRTKVLMVHHNIYNTWSWTGGHADGDGDFLKVAIKEAKEETGLLNVKAIDNKIISIDILPVWGHVKRGKYVSSHLHLNVTYALQASEDETLIINEMENSGVKWIGINEISKFSNEEYLIEVYNKIIERVTSNL